MNLYANRHGQTLEFEVTLHESAETAVWYVQHLHSNGESGYDFFVETYQEPSERYLVEKILDGYAAEVAADHAARIRHELDLGVI